MKSFHPFLSEITLHVDGRVSADDASRQERTAQAILERLAAQPGVILADEVGMGKTFVALAVAASVALNDARRRPVVVMAPPSLKEKWPADFSVFRERCLGAKTAERVRAGSADRATQFLKLLDDPIERRKSVIFLTHGAMCRGLNDKWVMLALVRQALYRRHNVDRLRRALCRILGKLLQLPQIDRQNTDVWERLLRTDPADWKTTLERAGVSNWDTAGDAIDDDPVPEAICNILPQLDTTAVFDALRLIPMMKSVHYNQRIADARRVILAATRDLWNDCLTKMKLKLPLLILDEAHHLKNPETKLASLFQCEEAREDADEIAKGPLGGVFERMLFLTATPFQLGHEELCSVLDRFDGIDWTPARAPSCGRAGFTDARRQMRSTLDAAQEAAIALDHAWGRMKPHDLVVDDADFDDSAQWWDHARRGEQLSGNAADVVRCYERARKRLKEAEREIRPWIIRHLKPRRLSGAARGQLRREKHPGGAILGAGANGRDLGIPLAGEALLPFLLAARATSHSPESRPVFAEGLASSFEAFLHTRRSHDREVWPAVDSDDNDHGTRPALTGAIGWYLDQLESLLPTGKQGVAHPKVSATAAKVVEIWGCGEKVVVFCHYVATGKILRQRISEAIQGEIERLGAAKLGCRERDVGERLDLIGRRFFDEDSPLRRACDVAAREILQRHPGLADFAEDLVEIVRRNVRTPAFLIRYFPLERERLDDDAVSAAFKARDQSGLSLEGLLRQFFSFLTDRCGETERTRYIDAVRRIQTGAHFGLDAAQAYADDELQGDAPEQLLPNVRLVNGTTRPDTRQRLMLTFNTPFYPEVLVASSVMAEGVDLHLNCRYAIHHDLCWNPSTLEQRTGRVDRIGAKTETCGVPIQVYLPYIAETQDEKMYRVVIDRERWFSVLMGEDYKTDARTTDKLAERVPFPAHAAAELAFDLGINGEPERETNGVPFMPKPVE